MCICMYIYMYIFEYLYICCTRLRARPCIHMHMYVYDSEAYMYTYEYIHVYVYICLCIFYTSQGNECFTEEVFLYHKSTPYLNFGRCWVIFEGRSKILPETKLFSHEFEQSCSAIATQNLEEKQSNTIRAIKRPRTRSAAVHHWHESVLRMSAYERDLVTNEKVKCRRMQHQTKMAAGACACRGHTWQSR